jgi:hypothetical protein
MNRIRFGIFVLALLLGGSLFAQSQRELAQLMHERGEYYFTLTIQQPSEVQEINRVCSVDGIDGMNVVCYANQKQYDNLLQAGYKPTLQTPPSMLEEAKMWDGNRATYEWDSYPTYSQYESMMQAFPSSVVSGRACTYMELGTLQSNRKIMGVRINNGSPEGKPKFLYSSTIHGDETTGWVLMLRLIDELCTSTDGRIINLVDNLDIFIFPNTNPDGTYYGGNNTVNSARRANANSVDMNRNYPDPHGNAHPDGNAYQTETQWFMQLAEDYPFVMAANYHGGAQVVNYPWDNTYTRHADDAWWQYVSREYATFAQSVSSNYMTDQNNGITNGADWYEIGGGRQDYMNGYRQCREVTVECSTTKKPNGSQLPTFWNYNHNSMLAYMEQCIYGIHGVVKDFYTHQPISGVIVTVQNHDDEYSIVSTHEVGDFHRPIKGGNWTLVLSKEGYVSQDINVTVIDGQRTDLGTIYLVPENVPIVEESFNLTSDWNWWSPNVDIDLATFEAALGANGVTITDQNGKYVNNAAYGWGGSLQEVGIAVGSMYKVKTNQACTITVEGSIVDPAEYPITLTPGINWVGFIGIEDMTLDEAFSNLTPTHLDYIQTRNGIATYYQGYGWRGSATTLHPGEGFIYKSKATQSKTFTYPILN